MKRFFAPLLAILLAPLLACASATPTDSFTAFFESAAKAKAKLDELSAEHVDLVERSIMLGQTVEQVKGLQAQLVADGNMAEASESLGQMMQRPENVPISLRMPMIKLAHELGQAAKKDDMDKGLALLEQAEAHMKKSAELMSLSMDSEQMVAWQNELLQATKDVTQGVALTNRSEHQYQNPIERLLRGFPEVLRFIESGDFDAADRELKSLQSSIGSSDFFLVVVARLAQLRTDLIKLQEANEAAFLAEMDELRSTMGEQLLDSKKPGDVDALLNQLQKLQDNQAVRSNRNAMSDLGNLHIFVTTWQNYLLDLEMGDMKRAQNHINGLTSRSADFSIIPRSVLLKMAAGLDPNAPKAAASQSPSTPAVDPNAQYDQILISVESLDDVPGSLEKIDELMRGGLKVNYNVNHYEGAFRNFNGVMEALEAGNHVLVMDLMSSQVSSSRMRDNIRHEALFSELKWRVLKALTPKGVRIEKEPKSYDAYAEAVASILSKEQRWPEFIEFLNVYETFLQRTSGPGDWVKPDIKAIQDYLVAQRYVKAQEYGFAWENLKDVIDRSVRYGPVKEAEALMIEIKEKHSDELEKQLATPLIQVSTSPQRMASRPSFGARNSGLSREDVQKIVDAAVEKQMLALELKETKDNDAKPAANN